MLTYFTYSIMACTCNIARKSTEVLYPRARQPCFQLASVAAIKLLPKMAEIKESFSFCSDGFFVYT
jgi:hypothetical protein